MVIRAAAVAAIANSIITAMLHQYFLLLILLSIIILQSLWSPLVVNSSMEVLPIVELQLKPVVIPMAEAKMPGFRSTPRVVRFVKN